jgi:alkanesulfonate monooxygenase SsuD/methylene tetrahydromethanopterin reductase-like flavin-dependent oxidoreductase (luciferase family)
VTTARFGLCLPQFTDDARGVIDAARAAEADGYDALSLFDHLRPLGGAPDRPILECLTLLAAVAASTHRVSVLPLVMRATLRPPATVAAVFRTLALTAPDRVVCAVGGGDRLNEAEDRAVGLPAHTSAERHAAVAAVITQMRAEAPGVPIWLGGTGPTLQRMAGEYADGWNVWAAVPEALRAGAANVRRVAAAADRPAPPTITWGGQVLLAPTQLQADDRLAAWGAGRSEVELAGVVRGDAEVVARGLAALVDAGAEVLMLSFVGVGSADARRVFASDVLPRLRSGDV